MAQSSHPPIDTPDLPDQSPHYVRAVTEMGEDQEIVAQEDIFATNGMKLLAKGARINRSQFDRLNVHKLRVPIDLLLATQQPVDANQLANEANKLLANDPAMARMVQRTGDPHGFRHTLGLLSLPPPLTFRLTVMREERNGLFLHSLRVALIAHSLAIRLGLSLQEKADLLLAALCHDLGEMHTDPALLEPGHRITPEERRYVLVHPVTSFVLLRDLHGLPAATLQAVLQHHERLDGSGYPGGLTESGMHRLGKLLSVAEVMEGVVRRGDFQRLDVLLRLNQRRLDPACLGALRELLKNDAAEAPPAPQESDDMSHMRRLADVLAAWNTLRTSTRLQTLVDTDFRFLQERMDLLRSLALQTGIDPDDMEALLEIAREDSAVLRELHATLDELGWLMRDISNEIERRTETMASQYRELVIGLVALLRAG